ncbi:DsbA family oxidoreductase [Empedobacter falsenii]
MKIEIWSDVMCPFCYIGKHNLEKALENLEYKDQIEIIWKSYQLDASIPEVVNDTYAGYLSKKRNVSEEQGNQMLASVSTTAKQIGLDYHFDKTIMTNSFKAHRLIQFAKSKAKGSQMEERLFKAFFTEGKNVSDTDTLIQLAKEIGLEKNEISAAFTDDIYAYQVKNDINEAIQLGVTGVPFFVLDRKYGISGAQPSDVFSNTIEKAFEEWKLNQTKTNLDIQNGQSCSIDGQCD